MATTEYAYQYNASTRKVAVLIMLVEPTKVVTLRSDRILWHVSWHECTFEDDKKFRVSDPIMAYEPV